MSQAVASTSAPKFFVKRVGFYTIIAVLMAFFAIPMLWMATAPFTKNPTYAVSMGPWTLDNFKRTFENPYVFTSLWNSLLLCGTVAILVTVCGALASYALSRVRFKGRDAFLYTLLLLSSIVTGTAAMVPIFILMFQLGLIDSRFGTALVLSGGLLPAAIFILKDFIDGVPKSYEESARVFGASTGQILRHVVLPVARPGLATIIVWAFVNAWGNFLLPFLLLRSTDTQPAAVILKTLQDEGGSVDLRVVPVFSLLYSIPVIILYLIVSKKYGFRFHGGIKS